MKMTREMKNPGPKPLEAVRNRGVRSGEVLRGQSAGRSVLARAPEDDRPLRVRVFDIRAAKRFVGCAFFDVL